MTPEQYLALGREIADHLRPLTRFRVCCGARLGEALSLDWREVDLGAGHVIFLPDKTKGRKKRIAALTPSAIEALASIPHRNGRVFLRPGQGGKKGAPMVPYADTEGRWGGRSEEHTSELQSLMRISSAVFCLTQKHILNSTPSDIEQSAEQI